MPERKPISVTWFILSNEKRNSIRASVPRLIWLLESAAARSPGIALWFLPRFFSLLAADSAFIAYFSFKSAFQCVLSRGFSLWFLPQTPSARPREVCAPRNQQGQWEAWSSAVSPSLPLLRREVFNRESELLHCKWHFSLKKKKRCGAQSSPACVASSCGLGIVGPPLLSSVTTRGPGLGGFIFPPKTSLAEVHIRSQLSGVPACPSTCRRAVSPGSARP